MLTPSAHKHQIELLERTLSALRDNEPSPCCLNCDLFDKHTGICPSYGPIAPEYRREAGCPTWQEAIPF